MGTQFFQYRHHRIGRAAAAQNKDLFPGKCQPAPLGHGPETCVVRIVTNETSVWSPHNGVHRTQLPCRG